MVRLRVGSRSLLVAIVVLIVLAVAACAPQTRPSTGALDTPEHHTFTGMKLLGQEKYADAQRAFELALELDPKYSQAHAGMGLCLVYTGNPQAARESLERAWRYAATNPEKLLVYTSRIRLITETRTDANWLTRARSEFDEAVRLDATCAPAYYFMGRAEKAALEFDAAGRMYKKVLELNAQYTAEADAEWRFIQKVVRAMPGTKTGKQIALVEALTRADAAALLMEELKIDVLYKKRTPRTFDPSFKEPRTASGPAAAQNPLPADVADHPLRMDIEGVLSLGVRGLETYPDGYFHPADQVSRAAYAMMLEDILIKVTGDQALATRFIGAKSPFPDLRADLPYFNAVMVVTTRGIMTPADMTTGEFAPLGPVAGVDALLVIRRMKEELKID
ncbi:MAG TPA: tetratricopeptide repeat protein [Smithellaceae bacterium]|nr:tetratricopeptide repeat protein [Smithellaceae bacterium]